LRQTTSVDSHHIAKELGCTIKQLKIFEKEIQNDEICNWVKYNGMPACFGEIVTNTVICDSCKNRINYVPCVQCCTHQGIKCRNDAEPELPFDPYPTDAIPGSLDKIAVMEQRAMRGYSIFSPQDRCDFGPRYEPESE
jgi:hypothetical protein